MLIKLELLGLVILANAVPILLYDLLKERWAWPLDGGLQLSDGRRLLGPSATLRGLVASVGVTAVIAMLLGHPLGVGVVIGFAAMLGDACSSFIKRRFGMASGDMALGLDQIPESLFPMVAVMNHFDLSWWDVGLLVLGFVVFELCISRLLYRFHLRERPY
jgi:CDP-2,3-bis-(O-geranylgeranyl)-sn-glycerol synthase